MILAALRLFLCVFSVLFDQFVMVELLCEVRVLVVARRWVHGHWNRLVLKVVLALLGILLLDWGIESALVWSLVSVEVEPFVLYSLFKFALVL